MNMIDKKLVDKTMRNQSGLTRRQMLAGSAGLTFAFAFAPAMDALALGIPLLRRIPHPSDDDIRTALSGNLCRCTGYVKIIESVKSAAEMTP